MIKGFIFDLDGTTLDTLHDLHYSFNEALRHYGMEERTLDEIRMGVGSGLKVLVDRCTPKGTDEKLKKEIGELYWKTYGENYDRSTRPYEGMREVMSTLQEKGMKLAINSNKGDEIVKKLIAQNYPDIDFVEVVGDTEGIAHKPDPQGPNFIIEKMKLKKEEVVYVGDSDIDILTAKNTGLRSIGCTWGFRDIETLKKAGADHIVQRPYEIIELLEKGEL